MAKKVKKYKWPDGTSQPAILMWVAIGDVIEMVLDGKIRRHPPIREGKYLAFHKDCSKIIKNGKVEYENKYV